MSDAAKPRWPLSVAIIVALFSGLALALLTLGLREFSKYVSNALDRHSCTPGWGSDFFIDLLPVPLLVLCVVGCIRRRRWIRFPCLVLLVGCALLLESSLGAFLIGDRHSGDVVRAVGAAGCILLASTLLLGRDVKQWFADPDSEAMRRRFRR